MENINRVVSQIGPIDVEFEQKAQTHLDNLTKPVGSLGRLEWLAKKIVGIQKNMKPSVKNKVVFTVAGDHGVAEEGVSSYPQEVTVQMVRNFLAGGAAINVLSRFAGARVIVVDAGVKQDIDVKHPDFIVSKVGYGTDNFVKGPAMTRTDAIKSIENGINIFYKCKKSGIDIAGVGEMGIGNTTSSSAVAAAVMHVPVEKVVGRGTGIDDEALQKKIEVIEKGILFNKPIKDDAVDVLTKVGGFEIGTIAGIILAAAEHRVPVLIDGFIAAAGALIAFTLSGNVHPYLIASHRSQEPGHKIILDYMNLLPILDLDLRLGEGTGAALAMNIAEASIRIFNDMATFQSAGVSTNKSPV